MTGTRPDGQEAVRTEMIDRGPAEALAGLLDIDLPARDALPPLWHWIYLPERTRQSALGPDGHPRSGIPAPPAVDAVRMFAGGRVATHAPIRFGTPLTRTTRLVRTVEKQGRHGPLTIVTVCHEWEQAGTLAVVDEQDIVYRAPGSRPAVPGGAAGGDPAPATGPRLEFAVDPVVLFRFSALTYNAHRIHYDAGYAAGEGYPDLVVHGPLQALLMGELLRRSGEDLHGARFAYRLVAPAFGAQTLTVSADTDRTPAEVRVHDGDARLTATATLQRM
jgi:3-methylfumaryl-CoA hydratase